MKSDSDSNAKPPPCERCGNFEALELAGKFLCADCVTLAGGGCAGHGETSADGD